LISIIIPTYNGLEHLKTCFESLRKQTLNFQTGNDPCVKLVLVDNGSTDGTLDFIKINYPEIEVVKLAKNYGFAKAVNEGIKYSFKNEKVTHIVLLNNDIECEENFLEEMMKGFVDESVGSVACKMLNFYRRNIIDDAGDFIKLIGSPYARGHAEEDKGQYDKEEFIFGACAGAVLYSKDVFESIGYFDEDFFAYYEDVDFSLRMQLAGFKCYYNPKAVCYHKRGATGGYSTGWMTMLCEKNLIALRIKNYPLSLYLGLTPLFLIGRLKRYYGFLKAKMYKVFISAIKGYLFGLLNIPKNIYKRKKIQKLKKVDNKYIYTILTYKKNKFDI
jgi:GT2 family glycosyltransferase